MAATNFTPIILYHTTTASAAPTAGNLNNGELAINITDGKLFYKDNGGTVQVIATKGTGTIGGSNTQVQYNSSGALAGSSNFTFNGTTATINTLNLTNALGTTFGGTGLNSYTTGDLVYASGSNTLAKLGIGLNTYILTSTGSVPQWSAPSAVTVSTANNLAGGAAGSVPYQSGAGATTFLSIGTAGQILTSTGTAPQWSTLTGVAVTTLSFGTTGLTPSTATSGAITVAGTLATTNGGTGLTSFSANQVFYASSTSAIGQSANLTFDGTTLVAANLTDSSLTTGRVVYTTTGGNLTDSANLLYSGTDLTVYGITVGRGAGAVASNTAVGASALAANTGSFNVAIGADAAKNATAFANATVVGMNALSTGVATGTYITAVGTSAMQKLTSGSYVTGVGVLALKENTTGSYNTALGVEALQANTTASYNTAVGYQAGYSNQTGSTITAVGAFALYSNTAPYNTAVGRNALYSNTTGQFNVAVGTYEGGGNSVLVSNTTGSYNTAMGGGALAQNTTASNNTAVGYRSLYSNTTGTLNTALGAETLYSNVSTSSNIAIGNSALYSHTTAADGGSNIAIGQGAAFSSVSGQGLVAIGQGALYANTSGQSNTAVGGYNGIVNAAMRFNTTGSYNTALGTGALNSNTTASNNTAVGYQAGYAQTTADGNALFGYQAGTSLTTGNLNSFFGAAAGGAITTGAKNTILGRFNGNQGGLDIRTANNYIVLSDGDGNPRIWWGANVAAINTTSGTLSSDLTIRNPNGTSSGALSLAATSAGGGGASAIVMGNNDSGGTAGPSVIVAANRNLQLGRGDSFSSRTGGTTTTDLWVNEYGIGLQGNQPSSGIGVAFPATQSASSNANTLDDYERGTWTPSVASTGGATFTYGASTGGTYIKIGRWMYLMGVMNVATKSGGSSGDGLAIILPINAGASDVSGSGVGYHISAATCTNLTVPSGYSGFPQGGVCTPNQASFYPYWTDGANNRILQLGDIANGFQIQFSIAVFTNT